jgi:hypothetical protein
MFFISPVYVLYVLYAYITNRPQSKVVGIIKNSFNFSESKSIFCLKNLVSFRNRRLQ